MIAFLVVQLASTTKRTDPPIPLLRRVSSGVQCCIGCRNAKTPSLESCVTACAQHGIDTAASAQLKYTLMPRVSITRTVFQQASLSIQLEISTLPIAPTHNCSLEQPSCATQVRALSTHVHSQSITFASHRYFALLASTRYLVGAYLLGTMTIGSLLLVYVPVIPGAMVYMWLNRSSCY